MAKSINATRYEEITALSKRGKRCIHAVIETAKNSPHKYALKPKYGIIAIHDVLPDGMHWPYDYGFVPSTNCADGDPLDVLVITQQGLFSGCLATVRLLGAIRETKNGIENDRMIAALMKSEGAPQPSDDWRELSDVPKPLLKEIKQFLVGYSRLQGNRIKLKSTVNSKQAMALVRKAEKRFRNGAKG